MAGPFFKRLGHMKMQNVLGMIGLNIFCGIMALGNEHRQGLAIAVSAVHPNILLRFQQRSIDEGLR